jgi:transposase
LKPVRKRKLVDEMRAEWSVSIRRACRVIELDTSTYHYKSRRPGQASLELRIREICQTRVRYGYRRLHIQLQREGWSHGQNKTRRIYRELGLQLRNKTPKRRVKAKLREDRRNATRPNETWAISLLAVSVARRIRDRDHVKSVAKQPCLICGRRPADAHHLRFAQSPALGRKVSDEFTVPLCRGHHREVHRCGDEAAWWDKAGIDPTVTARSLWLQTHPLARAGNSVSALHTGEPKIQIEANSQSGSDDHVPSNRG